MPLWPWSRTITWPEDESFPLNLAVEGRSATSSSAARSTTYRNSSHHLPSSLNRASSCIERKIPPSSIPGSPFMKASVSPNRKYFAGVVNLS